MTGESLFRGVKFFCDTSAGLSYDEDNVSKFCVIRQGIIKHLFGVKKY